MIVSFSLPFRRCGIVSTLEDFVHLLDGTFHYQLTKWRAILALNLFSVSFKLKLLKM